MLHPSFHRIAAAAAAAVLAAATAAPAAAQDYTPPSVRAHRLADDERVVLDGRLDESAWGRAPAAGGFRQREPAVGEPATQPTEVRVVYDGATLYVGVRADQPDHPVIARTLERDRILSSGFDGRPVFSGDDAVVLLLDTFHDHRNAFMFATNPNGAEFDALLTDEGREFNVDWRGVWEVRSARTADGWSAEFAIPFRTLRFRSGAGAEPWGLNVARLVRATNEQTLWSSWRRENEGMVRISRAGHLEGLDALPPPGLNLEVKPFGLVGGTQVDTLPGLPGSPPSAPMAGWTWAWTPSGRSARGSPSTSPPTPTSPRSRRTTSRSTSPASHSSSPRSATSSSRTPASSTSASAASSSRRPSSCSSPAGSGSTPTARSR